MWKMYNKTIIEFGFRMSRFQISVRLMSKISDYSKTFIKRTL